MRCLVVDDDPKFRSYVASGLEQSGIGCKSAPDGPSALALLEQSEPGTFDVILLDVMLPVQSGWELLHDLRASGRETPVIFVTARDAVQERVKGLELGADDYIIKPFAFEELVARVGAVVRRRQALPPLVYADIELDLARRAVRRAGSVIDLSPREFDVLRALVSKHDRVVTRAELLREVWGIDVEPETNIVDVHVARLRKKLDRHGRPLIQTARGEGYKVAMGGEPSA